MNYSSRFAPVVLRLGLASVFIWFGLNQLLDPGMWTSFIPGWAISLTGASAGTLVFLNGLFEVGMGVLLAYGIWVRWVALLLCLHLFMIVVEVGLGPIGVRDAGLSVASLSLSLFGSDQLSLEWIG